MAPYARPKGQGAGLGGNYSGRRGPVSDLRAGASRGAIRGDGSARSRDPGDRRAHPIPQLRRLLVAISWWTGSRARVRHVLARGPAHRAARAHPPHPADRSRRLNSTHRTRLGSAGNEAGGPDTTRGESFYLGVSQESLDLALSPPLPDAVTTQQ